MSERCFRFSLWCKLVCWKAQSCYSHGITIQWVNQETKLLLLLLLATAVLRDRQKRPQMAAGMWHGGGGRVMGQRRGHKVTNATMQSLGTWLINAARPLRRIHNGIVQIEKEITRGVCCVSASEWFTRSSTTTRILYTPRHRAL